jgi:hypothetical protein
MYMKRGRKGKYETDIKPRFDEITHWLRSGASEKQIYENLGITKDTFYRYKRNYKEFYDLLKNGRQALVMQLRNTLIKKAMGFEYTEVKQYAREENGNKVTYVEKTTKTALPDVAALNLCLKNYDPDNWANDPQALKMKEKELELRREIAEKDEW